MAYKNLLYCFVALVFFCPFVQAQISVSFNPAVYGQSIEGLAFAQINNSLSSNLKISVSVEIRGSNRSEVARVKTGAFNIKPGINIIDRVAFSGGQFRFSSNYLGTIARESGRFPEGEYEYCFGIEVIETKEATLPPFFEQCFNYQLQPLTPLLLISPVEGDEVCNKRPNFIWQPPVPLSVTARFRLLLTELKERQDPAEAIAYNTPLINQSNIYINNLNYPVYLPELKEGAHYAWQVTVYTDKTILKKSEIWTFKVKCKEKSEPVVPGSYRELKESDDGNFYLTDRFLRFSFINPYAAGDLNYSIECISDDKLKIKNLPKLKMTPGLNKYDLDLSENSSVKSNKEYQLSLSLPTNRVLKLRFIYKQKEIE